MKIAQKIFFIIGVLLTMTACNEPDKKEVTETVVLPKNLVEQNLFRAMQLTENVINKQFNGEGMSMARSYNPFLKTSSTEIGSVWMYTSAIQATCAIIEALDVYKAKGNTELWEANHDKYIAILDKLIDNTDYYLGTFQLTSYTQTKTWSVYGVNRSTSKGTAKVDGIANVYDDQMWLIRELLLAYKITNNNKYLQKAEYLTQYVLDGWDTSRNSDGTEVGGITWGPGYVTKHACSNSPLISPLVWLHKLYKGKNDEIEHRYIDEVDRKTRKTKTLKKTEYYLDYAKKIYEWQKKYLLRTDGVYDDLVGGCTSSTPETENVDGVTYRKGSKCLDKAGPAITYNSGTMLSGAADLYQATGENKYLAHAVLLSDISFNHFAKPNQPKQGYYYYNVSGFNNWFNSVLMQGYIDVYPIYKNVDNYINTFQNNLDYGYEKYLQDGFLPINLLVGWNPDKGKNYVEGMFTFAYAAEYAVLAKFELEK